MAATHLTPETFQAEILEGKKTALIDFWADWCGPCKMLGPVIDQLSDELSGQAMVGKLNIDDHGSLAQQYGVMSIPTVIAFRDGKEIGRVVGLVPKARLEELLK